MALAAGSRVSGGSPAVRLDLCSRLVTPREPRDGPSSQRALDRWRRALSDAQFGLFRLEWVRLQGRRAGAELGLAARSAGTWSRACAAGSGPDGVLLPYLTNSGGRWRSSCRPGRSSGRRAPPGRGGIEASGPSRRRTAADDARAPLPATAPSLYVTPAPGAGDRRHVARLRRARALSGDGLRPAYTTKGAGAPSTPGPRAARRRGIMRVLEGSGKAARLVFVRAPTALRPTDRGSGSMSISPTSIAPRPKGAPPARASR